LLRSSSTLAGDNKSSSFFPLRIWEIFSSKGFLEVLNHSLKEVTISRDSDDGSAISCRVKDVDGESKVRWLEFEQNDLKKGKGERKNLVLDMHLIIGIHIIRFYRPNFFFCIYELMIISSLGLELSSWRGGSGFKESIY